MFRMTAIDLEPVAKSGARLDWARSGLAWCSKPTRRHRIADV